MTQQDMSFNLAMPEDTLNSMNRKKISVSCEEGMMLICKKNLEQKAMLENFKNEQMLSKNAFELQNAVVLTTLNSSSDNACENHEGCPSKFLLLCLNTIQNVLENDEAMINERGRPFFALPWGFEFWKYYSNGNDILDTSQSHSTTEQIAWIASTASDAITRREEEGLSMANPFLLYLVPSQQEAVKVHHVFKPLESVGIYTISLHPGASIDHQIHGLRKSEPEFLISTPDRLIELISVNAIDLSGVSLLVIDGPGYEGGSVDAIRRVRSSIPSSSQTMIFGSCLNH